MRHERWFGYSRSAIFVPIAILGVLALPTRAEHPPAVTWLVDPPGTITGFAADPRGNVYVAGSPPSSSFQPTPGAPYANRTGTTTSFFVKYDAEGQIVMATYLPDFVWKLAVEPTGDVLAAVTQDLPPDQTQLAVVRIDPVRLKATVLPVLTCSACGYLLKMALDGTGNVYLSANTRSTNFPVTPGAYQTSLRSKVSENLFIVKYNWKTGKVVYATYLGGSGQDSLREIVADGAGNAYVTGMTTSEDFPVTLGSYRTQAPTGNHTPGFITKLNPTGSALVYSTYFEGVVYKVVLDPVGGAFLGAGEVLAKLSTDGRQVVSSTRLKLGFAGFDAAGNIVGYGSSLLTSYPGINPLQLVGTPNFPFRYQNCLQSDGRTSTCLRSVLGKQSPEGEVIWSSMLGHDYHYLGPSNSVSGVAVDASGNIYAAINNFGLIKIEPVGPPPLFVTEGVVSSAGFQPWIAPGGLVSIFGTGLTTAQGIVTSPSYPLPASLEGTSVEILGEPAPILAVANLNGQEQVNVQAPLTGHGPGAFGLGLGRIFVRRGRALGYADIGVPNLWPSIFLATDGQPVVTHADYSLVSAANPAHAGETILIWSTGGGAVTPPVPAGTPAPLSPLSSTEITPAVTMGGLPAPVAFSGLAPGFVGLYQIAVTVPALPAGQTEVALGVPRTYGGGAEVTSRAMIAVQ